MGRMKIEVTQEFTPQSGVRTELDTTVNGEFYAVTIWRTDAPAARNYCGGRIFRIYIRQYSEPNYCSTHAYLEHNGDWVVEPTRDEVKALINYIVKKYNR